MKATPSKDTTQKGPHPDQMTEKWHLQKLYLDMTERLAVHAYEATAAQHRLNMAAQQVTNECVKSLYAVFTALPDKKTEQ